MSLIFQDGSYTLGFGHSPSGQAQPIQPQSQGTTYGQSQRANKALPYAAYRQGRPGAGYAPSQTQSQPSRPHRPRPSRPQATPFQQGAGGGGSAYGTRPSPFRQPPPTPVTLPGAIPGVSDNAWENRHRPPLPAGYEWERVNVGTRSEGWMPRPAQHTSQPQGTPHGSPSPQQGSPPQLPDTYGLKPGEQFGVPGQRPPMEFYGGGFDDPRWRHNGGHWGGSGDFLGQRRPQSPPTPTPSSPPFSSSMTDGFGAPATPESFWPQQQAFVSRLLNTMSQIPGGTYLGQGAPPPGWGQRPPIDAAAMWGAAGNDVANGWQNPLRGLFG